MKKIFTLIVCLLTISLSAQQKIAQKIAELKESKTAFKRFSVLDASAQVASGDAAKVVDKASYARIRSAEVANIATARPQAIELDIPYLGNQLTVELFRVDDVIHESFQMDTDKQKNVPYQAGAYYRGTLKDQGNTLVAMNFFNGELSGVISGDNIGNIVIGKVVKAGNVEDYIIYSDADLKIRNTFECGMKADAVDEHDHSEDDNSGKSSLSTRCVTVYFEIDHAIYNQLSGDLDSVGNWITGVFNNVATLYANEGITVALKSTFVWTQPDPYSGNSSSAYLNQFNANTPVFNGDVGMLVGIDPGGLGGVAATINGLCSGSNYSYSDVELGYATVPTYSWTVMVVTHELGHLLGSPHTHACAWNNNNTPIDNCAPYAIGPTGEGYSCMSSPPIIPSTTVKGTIMSYCHLVDGVGISFTNGFGPQPAQRILNTVNNATCLSTDCINTCINTVTDIQASVTNNTATITWSELGSATQWQVQVIPFTINFGTFTTVSSPTFTASNLQPNTFYRARIRPLCASGMTSSLRQFVFATGANWCDGITITDTGGINGNYTNEQDYVRVLIPSQPNKKIELALTQFDLEEGYDYLYIYDGATTSAPDMTVGGLSGVDAQPPLPTFVSTSPDGALTLRFTSDQGVVESGFTAVVSCQNLLGLGDVQNVDFTYYPNPAKDAVNIISKTEISSIEVFNVAGQLLYSSKANALETKIDISAFSTGTYFFKLKFGEQNANFKIVKF